MRTTSGNGNPAAARQGVAFPGVVPVLPPRRNSATLAIFLFAVLLGLIILMAWLFMRNSKSALTDPALAPITESPLACACLRATNR